LDEWIQIQEAGMGPEKEKQEELLVYIEVREAGRLFLLLRSPSWASKNRGFVSGLVSAKIFSMVNFSVFEPKLRMQSAVK
jgi:hypothetical protein